MGEQDPVWCVYVCMCVLWEYEGGVHSIRLCLTHTHTLDALSVSLLQINYFQLPLESLMPNKAMGTHSREAVYGVCVGSVSVRKV